MPVGTHVSPWVFPGNLVLEVQAHLIVSPADPSDHP
jgi:hypothetical protein